MDTLTLNAERRTKIGTHAARALRKAGQVPAIIYGHGETPESVSMALHDVEVALAHGARMLEVSIDGSKKRFLIKAVQYDHLATTPIHLDLTRFDADERVKVRVGIELRGVAKGISDGGILDQHMADLEVECLVTDIPETLHPFVTELGLGDSLYVKELTLPDGVVALADADERVATVRVLATTDETEEADEEEDKDSAEPERIGRVRKDDEPKKDA